MIIVTTLPLFCSEMGCLFSTNYVGSFLLFFNAELCVISYRMMLVYLLLSGKQGCGSGAFVNSFASKQIHRNFACKIRRVRW